MADKQPPNDHLTAIVAIADKLATAGTYQGGNSGYLRREADYLKRFRAAYRHLIVSVDNHTSDWDESTATAAADAFPTGT